LRIIPQFLTERPTMAKRHFESKRKGMINDDSSAPSLCPRHVIDEYWGERPGNGGGHIKKDKFQGVQDQLNEDAGDFARLHKGGKY
jgi:hypothetical protein